jgi:hypothetical protein
MEGGGSTPSVCVDVSILATNAMRKQKKKQKQRKQLFFHVSDGSGVKGISAADIGWDLEPGAWAARSSGKS